MTLTKALTLAQSYETAVKDATTLIPNSASSQQIHRVQPTIKAQRAQSKKPCYRCTRTGYSPSACKFRKEHCHNCNKIAHIKKACTSRQQVKGVASRGVQYVDQTELPTRNGEAIKPGTEQERNGTN